MLSLQFIPHLRYYYRKPDSVLVNVPEVDISYKWAGGGLLSTVTDLLVFANAVLYRYDRLI